MRPHVSRPRARGSELMALSFSFTICYSHTSVLLNICISYSQSADTNKQIVKAQKTKQIHIRMHTCGAYTLNHFPFGSPWITGPIHSGRKDAVNETTFKGCQRTTGWTQYLITMNKVHKPFTNHEQSEKKGSVRQWVTRYSLRVISKDVWTMSKSVDWRTHHGPKCALGECCVV